MGQYLLSVHTVEGEVGDPMTHEEMQQSWKQIQVLEEELKSTENRIGFARQHYNDVVSQYNTSLQTFPANVVGGMFGFHPSEFFKLDAAEAAAVQKAPQVKF